MTFKVSKDDKNHKLDVCKLLKDYALWKAAKRKREKKEKAREKVEVVEDCGKCSKRWRCLERPSTANSNKICYHASYAIALRERRCLESFMNVCVSSPIDAQSTSWPSGLLSRE
eukprot:COSAG04_NODE_2500_length_4006_cov_6.400563_4_plen_114_part_00